MELRRVQEDYLEMIYILQQSGAIVRGADLAVRMKRSRPTVSVALKSLREQGYILYDEVSGIRLTEKGQNAAETVYGKHCLLKNILLWIGVSPENAEKDACQIEHIISEESYQKLKQVMETVL